MFYREESRRSPVSDLVDMLEFMKKLDEDRTKQDNEKKAKAKLSKVSTISVPHMIFILIATAPFTGMIYTWAIAKMFGEWREAMLLLVK